MDEQRGETEEEEVIGEGISESEVKELVPEWGWRRDTAYITAYITRTSIPTSYWSLYANLWSAHGTRHILAPFLDKSENGVDYVIHDCAI